MAKKKEITTELQVIKDELQPELLEIAKAGGIELSEASAIGMRFAPFMQFVNEHAALIDALDSVNPDKETAALARQYRLAMVANRGKNGMQPVKETLKESILIKGRLIDNYNNLVENSSKLSEQKAEAIERHQEREEAKKLELLAAKRVEILSAFGEVSSYIDFRSMDEASFQKMYENEKLAFEAKKKRDEEAEAKRVQDEKEAEERRLAEEKEAEEARLKKEQEDKAERDRIEAENEKLRLENEAKEKELAKEREAQAEKDRISKIESDRLAKIQAEKDAEIEKLRSEETLRIAKEKADADAKQKAADDAAKAEALKGDKEKVNELYVTIKNLPIPEFKTKAAQDVAAGVRAGILVMLQGIKDLAVHVK